MQSLLEGGGGCLQLTLQQPVTALKLSDQSIRLHFVQISPNISHTLCQQAWPIALSITVQAHQTPVQGSGYKQENQKGKTGILVQIPAHTSVKSYLLENIKLVVIRHTRTPHDAFITSDWV